MKKDQDYSRRIIDDLESVTNENRKMLLKRNSDYVFNLIYENVKLSCEKEITELNKINKNLADYVERFSNNILILISSVKEREEKEVYAISSIVNQLEEMKKMASGGGLKSQKEIAKKERKKIRDEESSRKIGSRPEKLSEKRKKRALHEESGEQP